VLDSVLEQRRGRLSQDFRLRTPDGHYLWFALKARPVVGSDGEVVRLVGTLTDVTEFKNAEERLAARRGARQSDRAAQPRAVPRPPRGVLAFAKADPAIKPTVIVIDLDRFKQVNDSVGIAVGDSILLTLARRLGGLLKPQDTLARLSATSSRSSCCRNRNPSASLPSPRRYAKDCARPSPSMTASSRWRLRWASHSAMASRTAPTRCSRTPSLRCITPSASAVIASRFSSRRCGHARTIAVSLESELRQAIERDEITMVYQPIVRLEDRSVAGFEAMPRWDHPKMRRCSPSEFIAAAKKSASSSISACYAGAHGAPVEQLATRPAPARSGLRQRQRVVAATTPPGPHP
jgi:hypothetical protein